MAYDLVISRLGALAGLSVKGQRRNVPMGFEDLKQAFAEHLQVIVDSDADRANDIIIKALRKIDAKAHKLPDNPVSMEPNGITVSRMPVGRKSDTLSGNDPLVGTLPWQRAACDVAGMKWILRSRASVTACALQPGARRTKLWWSFECIPAVPDPKKRPNKRHISAVVKLSEKICKVTMPLLRDAYRKALSRSTPAADEFQFSGESIRISLADNDTTAVAALFDAVCLEGRGVSDIESSTGVRLKEARSGLAELKGFVGDVVGDAEALTDRSLEVVDPEPRFPLISGILCHQNGTHTRNRTLAGFARRLGVRNGYLLLPPQQQRVYLEEASIRSASAARRLSAMLAGREASKFDPPAH